MPIIIPKDIPAYSTLKKENIFVITSKRAVMQDIRPIEIAILNLMPTKIETETQLLRVLSNSPLQINVTFIATESYRGKHTSEDHMSRFYKTFSSIKEKHFDGMIITGAPVENMKFEEVAYWEELKSILDFADRMVTSTVYICWGAQAALYYHYGIEKHDLHSKLFGVFPHKKKTKFDPLLKGFDDIFFIPHSRHTAVSDEDIKNCPQIEILAYGNETGPAIIKSKDNKKIFLSGHSEYDRDTLANEYWRDINKGMKINKPFNYFIDEAGTKIHASWFSTANLLFSNWLNYYVYQVTPFEF